MSYWIKTRTLFFLSSFFVLWVLQGCGIFGDDIAKRKPDSTLPEIYKARTLVDVGSVGFEWSAPKNLEGVEGYAIAIKDEKNKLKALSVIKNPYATHAYVSGLTPQARYDFYLIVLGKNKNIASRYKLIRVTTSYIDPVERVFTTGGLPREMKIFWTPHPNPSIRRYIVQREENGKFVNIGNVPHRLLVEFFDKKLEDGKQYTYRIIAESFEGKQSLPSEKVTGQTREKPLALQNVQASKDQPKSIVITWDKPVNPKYPITSYGIFASDKPDSGFKQVGTTANNFYKETGLASDETRFYKVVAIDQDGIMGDLNIPAVAGQSLPLPPTPKLTLSAVRKNAAVLKWEVGDDSRVESYKVCRSEKGSKKTRICFENITKPFFIDREMNEKILYYYEVYSIDKYGLESKPTPIAELER